LIFQCTRTTFYLFFRNCYQKWTINSWGTSI